MKLLLQSSTPAATGKMPAFRKELIKVGKYVKDSTKQVLDVTKDTLNHWVKTFDAWTKNGNKVPVPNGHTNDATANKGWVKKLEVVGDSLYGVMELLDETLAKTTDISICIEPKVVDGKGNIYESIITHVALTTTPVVPGLAGFETLSLSLDDDASGLNVMDKVVLARRKAAGMEDEPVTDGENAMEKEVNRRIRNAERK